MESKNKKSIYLLTAAGSLLLLLGIGVLCCQLVKSAAIQNEKKSLLRLAKVSANSLDNSLQAKKNLIYAAFSGDMDGEEEIQKSMIKVGEKGRYIRINDVSVQKEWIQAACGQAGKSPGEVIEDIGDSELAETDASAHKVYMTKAVYMKGSITGYVQMELELNEIYTVGANTSLSLTEGMENGCNVKWVYESVQGIPVKEKKLVAADSVPIGDRYLSLYLTADYNKIVKPYEYIFWMAGLAEVLLLFLLGTVMYQEIKRMKEAYNQSRLISTLTGAIAHEFNNLMTPIVLYTELLEENEAVYEQMPEEIKELKSSAGRCEELAGQLLQYTRLGRASKVLADYNATSAVRESLHMIERFLPDNIEIKISVSEKSYYIRGQSGAVTQIILNLSKNAIQAMKGGGTLTVQFGLSAEDNRMVRLLIKDTGTGIAPEIKRRIFEPFYTTKEKEGGTGIGLTVVKRLVEEHGGFIQVETSQSDGTCFLIDLPRVQERKDAEVIKESGNFF